VYSYDVEPTQDPLVVRIEVRCSSGTYVRTLAADLGTLLGGGAHLRNLRRTSIGDFTEHDALAPEQVKLLEPITALRSMTKVIADEATATAIRNGRPLPAWPGASPWAVVNEEGALLAVYEADGDVAKPSVVLAEAIA
jgi:tRNA pseudouridine55 synthase